jgi:hypothetical protein
MLFSQSNPDLNAVLPPTVMVETLESLRMKTLRR